MSYKIAAPDEYLAITGMRIKTIKITKAAFVFPFQRCMRFSVQPHDYAMNLQAMTKEKLQFLLPVIFTVGPDVNQRGANAGVESDERDENNAQNREDRGDSLMKYAMLLADARDESSSPSQDHVENIVKGIIEGEVRVLVSSMTMEEIFTEREVFKRRIFKNIQSELDQFGLKIYNANVKELRDAPNSVYFESLSRKAHEGAVNTARVDVAEAKLRGNVGEAKRHGEQEREIAKINAETAVLKTDRDLERATAIANLETQQATLTRDVDIARAEAQRALESRDEDLKRNVEVKRAAAELERLRASHVVEATAARESAQQAADARAYEVSADARAEYDRRQRDADADAYRIRQDAEAEAYRTRQGAEADLLAAQNRAEGTAAMADAYSKLAGAFGGPAGLLQYLMIEKGTFQELARANADAVSGMQPKISVWNTGAAQGSGGETGGAANPSGVDVMRNVYQMLPPLMTTINEQTGITLPEWQFGRLNAGLDAVQNEGKANGASNADRA